VIENKQSGAITHKQSEAAWQKLTETFNAVVTSGDRRTTKMLMEKQNKKKSTKHYRGNKQTYALQPLEIFQNKCLKMWIFLFLFLRVDDLIVRVQKYKDVF
jgi:hypothetical protein